MRILRLGVGVLAVALLGCHRRANLADIKSLTDRELPVGSSPQRALALLDSLHAEHSDYGANRVITANCGESYGKGPVSGNVYVVLYYDPRDHLSRAETKEVLTGP
jgi:hypothetical protein